jgi:large subunit ribosomal protein L6
MSRIGKQPIQLPSGVKVNLRGSEVEVSGTKGELKRKLPPRVKVEVVDGQIMVSPGDGGREARALHGLTRTLINNMVLGVTVGYTRVLELSGVGYRADVKSDTLHLSLGYSHPIEFKLPKGIQASVDKQNRITLTGIDKELLGLTAAKIRDFRRCEPYKGKGIRYAEEVVRRKVGKAGVK